MKQYILIGTCCFFGAILRYTIKSIPMEHSFVFFPWNTLAINILGSFFLSFIFSLKGEKLSRTIKVAITTGFLGAFTTFSTVCKEMTNLLLLQSYAIAFVYFIMSVILGISAAYLGFVCGHQCTTDPVKNNSEREDF